MVQSAQPLVAYFCAEFGIDSNLPTYAGGLGILAGDTLLEAAQQDIPMIGIGLLYQGKAFLQEFSETGWQVEHASPFQPENTKLVTPVEVGGKRLILTMQFDEEVKISAYQQRLGDKTTLYLLTTDIDGNSDRWRDIMLGEYCCNDETQLMQQFVLGVGGVKLLEALKINPEIYHFQEGRPIFAHWELIIDRLKPKKPQIVYTNHTLVPDGNLIYDSALVRKYAAFFAEHNNLSLEELLTPGLIENGGFSITQYALNVAAKVSAVSKYHWTLSQKTWPDHKWTYVTNGVHLGRWQFPEFKNRNLSDSQLWEAHLTRKRDLARIVKKRSGFTYDPERLVMGWARRISSYKQVHKIFSDAARLAKIVCVSDKPVQILISGKAHPGDNQGKSCIQEVMKVMTNELNAHALFIPNYDISLATHMVSGVDVWLNTPELGKEACGTSGMKALANGVLNTTVADGWAHEVNWEEIGWEIDHTNLPKSLYDLFETEIIPKFYTRDSQGFSPKWLKMMRHSLNLSQRFSAERMLKEYQEKVYYL